MTAAFFNLRRFLEECLESGMSSAGESLQLVFGVSVESLEVSFHPGASAVGVEEKSGVLNWWEVASVGVSDSSR